MIRGIGNDIIEIQRVKRACQSEAFLRYVYTVKEQECFRRLPASLAGNFAVKEAVAKMLGTGFSGFGPADIEVLRDEAGRPYVNLYAGARKRQQELGVEKIWVSISHTKEIAAASAVGEGA
ncbi:MAG: holo-ACP synthase [Lachnospiraceae bacterium]|jgi:holo-[acyl-carrier protein] synthase|nr:holo-ACP synthase [Lachnospiraceae bacterium]